MQKRRDRDGVAQENTYWRDAKISQRHRQWGFNCPTVDIDWLAVDYSQGRPVALIDWKALTAPEPNLRDANYQALRTLATAAKIPFMIVFYDSLNWMFRVIPANGVAVTIYQTIQVMSEFEFVSSLYVLRGIPLPGEIARRLSRFKPGGRR